MFEHPEFHEEFRTFEVEVRMIDTEFDPSHPIRPRIRFEGEMGDHSEITGWVRMTPDDQIRWNFVSIDY